MTTCPYCHRHGWVTPTPDSLARDREGNLWCTACGKSWDGTDAEIETALVEEAEHDAAMRKMRSGAAGAAPAKERL